MAKIANTAFEPRITNGRFDDEINIAGVYQSGSPLANDVASAGLLCKRSGLLGNEGYDNPAGTRVYNENSWIMVAAAATDNEDEVIYACNTYDVGFVESDGNLYPVSPRTLGLPSLTGRPCTFTRIDFDGQSVYRFGVGNLSTDLSTNTYFTIANGLLVPSASAPTDAGSIYFELRGTGNFVEGNSASFGYVDVVAKKVSVAA
jgi:hypothetical protein